MVLVVLISLIRPAFFESLDRKIYDLHFALRGPVPDSGRIVLVTIDEKSLQEMGRWPWPRDVIARLLEGIVRRGAKVVVPDIFFADSSGGPGGERRDRALADVLRRHPNIFMGFFFLTTPQELEESAVNEEQIRQNFQNLSGSSLDFGFKPSFLREGLGIQDVFPLFSRLPGGKRHGFFNMTGDPDGTVRKTPLLISYQGQVFPSLVLQAAMQVSSRNRSDFLERLRLDSQGDFFINYRGPDRIFPRVNADDILLDRDTPSLEDKIVMVGATAAGLEDNRTTPVNPTTPSLILGAHLMDNLVQGDFLFQNSRTRLISWTLIFSTGLILVLLLPRLRLLSGFLLFLGLLLANGLILHFLFVSCRWVVPGIYPLFSTFLVYGGTSLYGYLLETREKQLIKGTFEHYLSSEVIRELTDHPEKIRLGGERRELTVFFSDIRDFSSIAERSPPEILADFLNSYLTPVTDIILDHKGLLDKYIGDAVMAVFGAPLPEPVHPLLACRAAVDIVRFVNASQGMWKERYQVPQLRIGIGINTGFMTVGNMGSERRFDYTVIGDAVNLGSRIESLNKYYGTTTLVSEATYAQVKNDFPFRELDQVQVKGKKEVLRIFELLVDPGSEEVRLLIPFSEGLQLYREGQFLKAKLLFEKCLALNPSDGPSRLFYDRSLRLEASPPADWGGVTAFLEK